MVRLVFHLNVSGFQEFSGSSENSEKGKVEKKKKKVVAEVSVEIREKITIIYNNLINSSEKRYRFEETVSEKKKWRKQQQ